MNKKNEKLDSHNKTERCPICNEIGKFIPPNKTEGRKLIAKFRCPRCPNGYDEFTKVFFLV